MHTHLFDKVKSDKNNANILNGTVSEQDVNDECLNYSNKILNTRIDLAILGIGLNGHIAFNEPGSDLNSITRKIKLDPGTVKQNGVSYTHALTVGIKEILSARRIILIATGATKAAVVATLLHHLRDNTIDAQFPASYLSTHANVQLIVDEACIAGVTTQLHPRLSMDDN